MGSVIFNGFRNRVVTHLHPLRRCKLHQRLRSYAQMQPQFFFGFCRYYSDDSSDIGKNEGLSDTLAKPGGRIMVRHIKQKNEHGEPNDPDNPEQILDKDVVDAVANVAQSIKPDSGDEQAQVKTELLSKLVSQERETFEEKRISENSEMTMQLLTQMPFRSSSKRRPGTSSRHVKQHRLSTDDDERRPSWRSKYKSEPAEEDRMQEADTTALSFADLFEGPGLGIFPSKCAEGKDPCEEQPTPMPIWQQLDDRRKKLLVTQEPRNGFEELIRWTEEGKLWPYPIDNEYGFTEEDGISFHEHVFLEPLLDELDFPKTGPVRQFMELVCIGLSKNPYMTLKRKKDHINWYREYLEPHLEDIKKWHAEEKSHVEKLAAK